jgi:hypothetical protein
MDSQLARINQPVLFNIHLLILRPLHGNFSLIGACCFTRIGMAVWHRRSGNVGLWKSNGNRTLTAPPRRGNPPASEQRVHRRNNRISIVPHVDSLTTTV